MTKKEAIEKLRGVQGLLRNATQMTGDLGPGAFVGIGSVDAAIRTIDSVVDGALTTKRKAGAQGSRKPKGQG